MYEGQQNPIGFSLLDRSTLGCTEHPSKPSGKPEKPQPEIVFGDK